MQSVLRPIFSLMLGLLFLIVGHGIQLTLIPLRAEAEGWSKVEIGVLGSAYYVGFVLGCIGAPYLIRRAGHIRAFTVLAALITVAMIAHPLWVAFVPWILFRVALGASLAGLYMILESWVNDRVSNADRGVAMSVYIMVNYGALAIGQFAVTLASPMSFSLFAAAAMMMSIAAIPLALTRQTPPTPVAFVRLRPMALYRSSPVGLVGAAGGGLASGSFWSLGAVAALGAGLTPSQAAIFMAIATAAGALSQWPVGRVSDRVDRRLVLIAVLVAAAFFGLLLAFLPVGGRAWLLLAAFFGATIAPTYSLAAAHAYDHAEPGTTVETATGLFLVNASGAIVGPLVAASMMQHFGTSQLFLFTALVHLTLAAYVVTRVRARAAVAQSLKTGFDLAGTAQMPGGSPPEPPSNTPPDQNAAR